MASPIVETAPLVLNVGVVLLGAATMGFAAYLKVMEDFLLR
ncbi:MAG: hypothetical protein ACOVKH_03880 [Candidatus Nanopelagicus sp.]